MGRTLDNVVRYYIARVDLQKAREAKAKGEESIDENRRSQRRVQRQLIALRRELIEDGGNALTAVIDDTVMRERNSTKSPVED